MYYIDHHRSRRLARSLAVLTAAVTATLSAAPSLAQSGSWNQDADGDWSLPGNWTGGTVADGTDSTASFTNDITGDRTINLDGARTIGHLTFSDSPASNGWTLASDSSDVLTLDVTSGAPTLTVNPLGAGGKIAEISATLAGSDGLTKAGLGTLKLSGTNTYTGVTTIAAGDSNPPIVINVLEATVLADELRITESLI